MIAAHHLIESAEQTHRTLMAELDTAAAMQNVPGEPRKGFERTDVFLATTSRHLNAVEAVLLPAVQRHLDDGSELVRTFVRVTKELETSLVLAKAREYHSALAMTKRWEEVWDAVRRRLDHQRELELDLIRRLEAELDEDQLGEIAERLHEAELHAPSRPHPHSPHLGIRGRLARRMLHAVDSFWDTAEGRMIPEQRRPERKKPGRMTQYLLADPRFEEDEEK